MIHQVHFACHGIQDGENLTESGLRLADQRHLKFSEFHYRVAGARSCLRMPDNQR